MSGQEGARVPRAAALLGAAGLLPIAAALLAIAFPREVRGGGVGAAAIASAEIGYAMLIFNFLGGLWWGLAARTQPTPTWVYAASITPTLATVGLLTSAVYTSPALDLVPRFGAALGVAILLTLPIDRLLFQRGIAPGWWLKLRVPLSLCLGLGTIAVALLTPY